MRGNSVEKHSSWGGENDWNYIVFFLLVAKLFLMGQNVLIM